MKVLFLKALTILLITISLLVAFSISAQVSTSADNLTIRSTGLERVTALVKISGILIDKGLYDSAIATCQQGVVLCNQERGSDLKMSTLYNYIGASFQFKGDFDSAIHYFYIAAEKAEHNIDGELQLMRIYNNISLTFNRTLDNEKALLYLEKAERLALKNDWYKLLPAMLLNKGRIYKEQKQFSLSERTLLQALQVCDTVRHLEQASGIPKEVMQLMILTNLGQLNIDQSHTTSAKKYLEKALPLSIDVNPYYQVPVRLALGRVYVQLKDYKLAEEHVSFALAKSTQAKINDGLSEANLLLSKIFEAQEKYQQAYYHLKQAYHLEENLRGVDRTKDSRLLEVKYRTAQKDKEIAERQLSVISKDRLLKNKNLWIAGISFGLLSLLIVFFVVYKNYNHRQHLQEQKILSIEQEKHIEILSASAEGEEKERNRIASNLHDGIGSIISAAKMNFSTLHTLPKDKLIFERSMNLLNEAAFEIRSTAHNLMPQMLLQEGLVTATKDFCERVSNSKLLKIEYQAYGDFMPQQKNFELSVYRIIQELINNIIKHAHAQDALVQLSMGNNLLTITVEDNGKGMGAGDLDGGTGLKNIKNRVAILQGAISIDSIPNRGTQIYIEFELEKTKTAL